jgi:hypothetical protein
MSEKYTLIVEGVESDKIKDVLWDIPEKCTFTIIPEDGSDLISRLKRVTFEDIPQGD